MSTSVVDIAVIGGGLAGLHAAVELGRSGVSVMLFDEQVFEPAWVSRLGLCVGGVFEQPWRLLASLGPVAFSELGALHLASLELLQSEGTPVGWRPAHERERGENVRSAQECGGRVDREGVLWMAADQVVCLGSAWGRLQQQLRQAGVVLVREEVVEVRGELVITSERKVQAEVVVFTAGVGNRALDSFLAGVLHPVREQVASFSVPDSPDEAGVSSYGWTRWSRVADTLKVGGCRWATAHLEVGEVEELSGGPVLKALTKTAQSLGAVGSAREEHSWIAAHSCDGLPFIGPLPGDSRRWTACGFGSNDVGLGAGAGRWLAQALVGERRELPGWVSCHRQV